MEHADWWNLDGWVELVGDRAELDGAAALVQRLGAPLSRHKVADSVLGGSAVLGHPVHPLLTDLPIGFWTSVMVLDLAGGRRSRDASQLLLALGVLTAVPTLLAGAHDAATLRDVREQRTAAVHAMCNSIATGLYAWSWRQRRHQHWSRGVVTALAGATVATAGGLLGGALVYRDDKDT